MTTGAEGPRPRGRRPGSPETREHILAVAWEVFLRDGFSAVSLRAVARAAECDPALVHYYFSSKEQLFFEAMHVPINADRVIDYVTSPGLPGMGRRLFAFLTAVYESPYGDRLVSTLTGDARTRTLLTRVIGERIRQVAEELLPAGRARRGRAMAQAETIIAGYITARCLLRSEHTAALSRDEAVVVYGDLLQDAIDQAAPPRAAAARPAGQTPSSPAP
ncbi:TetR family transcriptional regulator [Actinomyces israelii]|mgnify:FL=1|uniref:TetR family transcriptional regulator n=1 Tax=Actinomyces israelii TaxID=1659 RepID=A0ABT4I560_9ACTO|nr:TetR/AcrR family transcriptional regulator [Actinomyces israelii]MCZ0856870.1 TetR family transcriptional regulator [Actinomyces israelii]